MLNRTQKKLKRRHQKLLSSLEFVQTNCLEALIGQLKPTDDCSLMTSILTTLRLLCSDNHENKLRTMKSGAIRPIVQMLRSQPDPITKEGITTLAAIVEDNWEIQMAVVDHTEEGDSTAWIITQLLRRHDAMEVQIEACNLIEKIVKGNTYCQKMFINVGCLETLIGLIKTFSTELKEKAALAMWSLSGEENQKMSAEMIGMGVLIEMIMDDSQILQLIGSEAIKAMIHEDASKQDKMADHGVVNSLMRIIRNSKMSSHVLMSVAGVVIHLSVGLALRNNHNTQTKLAEKGMIFWLSEKLHELERTNETIDDKLLMAEILTAISCLVLRNKNNQDIFVKHSDKFTFNVFNNLLDFDEKMIQLKSGKALAIFCLNKVFHQKVKKEVNSRCIDNISKLLDSGNRFDRSEAAFQVIVLVKVISTERRVELTSKSLLRLVDNLEAPLDDEIIVLTSDLISCLANMNSEVTGALSATSAVDSLCNHILASDKRNQKVVLSASTTLSYLSHNLTCSRRLLYKCRTNVGLYEAITKSLPHHSPLSPRFVDEFRWCRHVGLPNESLQTNEDKNIFANMSKRRHAISGQVIKHKGSLEHSVTILTEPEHDIEVSTDEPLL